MNTKEIAKALEIAGGSPFLTTSRLAKVLHKNKANVRDLMAGYQAWHDGNKIRYFCGDVAEVIAAHAERKA
jgi:hypothetical protein